MATSEKEEAAYSRANLDRQARGLKPFDGIEEFRRGIPAHQDRAEQVQAVRERLGVAERALEEAKHYGRDLSGPQAAIDKAHKDLRFLASDVKAPGPVN